MRAEQSGYKRTALYPWPKENHQIDLTSALYAATLNINASMFLELERQTNGKELNMSDTKTQPVKKQGQRNQQNMDPKHMGQNPDELRKKEQYQESQTEQHNSQREKQPAR